MLDPSDLQDVAIRNCGLRPFNLHLLHLVLLVRGFCAGALPSLVLFALVYMKDACHHESKKGSQLEKSAVSLGQGQVDEKGSSSGC